MPVTIQTVQAILQTGLTPVYNAANAGGDKFLNDGRTAIRVVNASGGDITVTVATQATLYGYAIADLVVTIPAGQQRVIGALEPAIFNDTDGYVTLTWSATTSVTFAVERLTPVT